MAKARKACVPVSESNPKLQPLTEGQRLYFDALRKATVTICTGPAGSGKTYIPCGMAVQEMQLGQIDKIVLSRPLQECDEEVGTEPGWMLDKVRGMFAPMLDALEEFMSPSAVEKAIKDGKIVICPLARMRGRTFKSEKGCRVILDEAQNCTYRQQRMFLTRFGVNSRVVMVGDETQSDLPYNGRNSLSQVIERLSGVDDAVRIVRLGKEDIVRHWLIQKIDERLA